MKTLFGYFLIDVLWLIGFVLNLSGAIVHFIEGNYGWFISCTICVLYLIGFLLITVINGGHYE